MKYFLSGFICLFSTVCFADPISITGNTTVQPGAIESYNVNWESWGSVYENYANVTWTITGGTLLSSDKHSATIQWDDIPTWENGTGRIDIEEDLGSQQGTVDIAIVNFIEGVSETCNGILGPPALTIDFGSGNNPGPPLPPGSTTYEYLDNCGIQHGQYSLTNTSSICHGDWLGIPQDHTPGDINGYMLIIDADDKRGEVYRATVNGLTNAFEYEFSVWVASVSNLGRSRSPKLHFEIQDNSNNVIIKSDSYIIEYNSGNPWVKISFMVPLPLGVTSVQVVLVNEHGSSSGNDFVVDDISFAPCYPPIVASFSSNPPAVTTSYICNNGIVSLYSWWPTPSIPYNNPGFKWQRSTDNGNTWFDITGATAMNYTQTENIPNRYYYRIIAYETSNPSQFVTSNSIIYFVQKMVVDAKIFYVNGCASSPTELKPTYNLQYSDPSVPLSYTFNWSPGSYLSSTQIENPTITLPQLPTPNPPNPPNPLPPVNYFYTLTVQNTNYGCIASNTQTVAHLNPRKVYIVNAFTPNGDGVNDFFRPINIQDYSNFGAEFWIYNRWGEVIFHKQAGTTLLDWSWDGKVVGIPQASGVFVWRLRIPGCPYNYVACSTCDTSPDNGAPTIHGTVTLVR